MLGDAAGAADVTQEAFVAAWRGINTFKLGQPFGPWLMKIVVRGALKRLPKEPVRLVSLDEPDGVTDIRDPAPDALNVLEAEERAAAVRKAINRLSRQRRHIVLLFYDAEQSIEEIAESLGLAAGTVKSELYRARQELGKMLKGLLGNEG